MEQELIAQQLKVAVKIIDKVAMEGWYPLKIIIPPYDTERINNNTVIKIIFSKLNKGNKTWIFVILKNGDAKDLGVHSSRGIQSE